MTARELNQLPYIKKLIKREEQRLARIEAILEPGGMNLNGMPHSPARRNKLEDLVPQIIEIKEQIKRRRRCYLAEQMRIEAFIDAIPDYQTKLIFSLRYVDCLSWGAVAAKVGGGNTADSVKKVCYRYLKRSQGR